MTEHHWISRLLMALLPFLFLSSTLFLQECAGQANSNFFYYYSPTQRTQISHGFDGSTPTSQIFNSPFFNQQQQQPIAQQSQQTAQQVQQPALPFPTAPPASFQQSTYLGFNQPQYQQQSAAHRFFPPAPPAQLQFPLVQPTPSQEPPQQQQQPFSTFNRFGNNAHLLGQFPQASQPSFFSTQSPLGTVSPGTFNFFQNPFQYLQQQFIQSTAAPVEAPAIPTPTTTVLPPPPPSPSPTDSAEVVDAPAMEITPRPRISSRFRYVQQPIQPQIRQYNPYTRLSTQYTSDLPFTEQRFYSSPTTPTGYAFSLGGDSGTTSTVHFSMGPMSNNAQHRQHITEITAPRRMLHRQRVKEPDFEIRTPAPPSDMLEFYNPPEEPVMSTTTTTTTPQPTTSPTLEPMPMMNPVPSEASMNSTLEPLLNEPSFQTETITAPVADSIAPEVSKKISETNIPKRLVIRKKVARKRLQLNGSGEMADNHGITMMPNGVMIRRRITSPNRLPVDELKQNEQMETQKGNVEPEASAAVTPSTTTTTTSTEADVEQQQSQEEEQHLMEPQPVSSPAVPQEAPMSHSEEPPMNHFEEPPMNHFEEPPMIHSEEAHMTMDTMPESQSMPNDDASVPDQAVSLPSSTTTASSHEVQPDMMQNEQEQVSVEQPSSTTPTPMQPPPVESHMLDSALPNNNQEPEEFYYEDEYEDEQPERTISDQAIPRKVMTVMIAPETSDELPVLRGVSKEDFPGVFHPHSGPLDNSVETDQGQVITRVTSSIPSSEEHDGGEVMDVPAPAPITIPSNTTEAPAAPDFMKVDPVEEHPPMETEVPSDPQPMATTEALPPMMTTTPTPMVSSTPKPSDSGEELSSGEVQSAEEQSEDAKPVPMPPQEAPIEVSCTEGPSSTTEAPEEPMISMDEASAMSSSTESLPQERSMEDEIAQVPDVMNGISSSTEAISISSSTEGASSSSTTEDSIMMSEMTNLSASSTESTQNEEMSNASSTTTMAPPTDSREQPVQIDDDSQENIAHSQEINSDSEEIGRAQRLALEETLRRLRERQQTSSSTSDPIEDDGAEADNEGQSGRKMFMRRPLPDLASLPLATSRPVTNVNAVLDEEDGVDRSQVIEKIQRFRQNFRTTTTKRPRRVTRPSPGSERRLSAVAPVVEERQEQVDSFSESSSTPGPATEPATTSQPFYLRGRTTPSSTTTVLPEESSTTPATLTMEDMQEELSYPVDTTSSTTEQYITTTRRPQMLTSVTEEASSTTEYMLMADEMSSTTETDIEPMTSRSQPDVTTTSTTEIPIMTTTAAPPRTTMPSASTSTSTDASTFDENDSNDLVYEDNFDSSLNVPLSSSTEVSTEIELDTMPSSTTIAPLSTSTDSVYAYVTTPDPISDGSSSTTIDPDISSSTTMTTPAGQLIIHEILPTMPPLKEVSFVIGESVEDDQSSANSSSANESDELLAADRAVVRVETNVHVVTNATDVSTEGASGEQMSQESQELTPQQQLTTKTSGEGGKQRRVRVVIKKQRRLRRPAGNGEGRRRRRKVLHQRPQ